MRLIKSVEAHYLRSLYKVELTDVGNINVIFGRNDSGKSNLLRALNLFFNGRTEPFRDFDFGLDMSDIRKEEAREAKGKQFIWIKVTFSIPQNYRQSLGGEVQVKRQWNRDGEINMTVWPKSLTEGKPNPRLTRFLNDIDFTYIPAIKDMSLYADLIERLYGAAAQSTPIANASEKFVQEIGRQNKSLTDSLGNLFSSKVTLSPPAELSQLFRNLDFSYGNEKHSLIRQKGDGIKARHIPEILRFINHNEHRSKFYIWGFEEPENSLDLGAAQAEANRFAELSEEPNTQVFLTSHSPAFYLLNSPSSYISRYFISKQTKKDSGIKPENASRPVRSLDEAETVMNSAGLLQLPYVIKSLKEMPETIHKIEKEKNQLEAQLSEIQTPTLFLEGKHDIKIIKSRFSEEQNIKIKELMGTPSTIPALLTALANESQFSLGIKALIVFDNDPSGRKAMRTIIGRQPIDFSMPENVVGQLHVMCLPFTYNSQFREFLNQVNLSQTDMIFEGEFLLDSRVVAQLLSKKDFDDSLLHQDYYRKSQELYQKMLAYEKGSCGWLFSRTVPDTLKEEVIDQCLAAGEPQALDGLEQKIRNFFDILT